MANLPNLQINIKHGLHLTAAERRLLITTLDERGRTSQRRFQGLREWPHSRTDKTGRGVSPGTWRMLRPDIPID